MQVKILCPQWGHEHLAIEAFFKKVKAAGYDGVDTWMPENDAERKKFVRLLDVYGLSIVCHQQLINSHSGRDFFTLDEQLRVIDTAENFSAKKNIRVVHETHRGRLCYEGPA